MTLEAGKEMDRRCVMDWLNEVYVTPSRAFDEYTEDELKMFAHDALVLLKEQDKTIESLTKEKEELLLERIAELQHNIDALHIAMQDTILVNNAIEQRKGSEVG